MNEFDTGVFRVSIYIVMLKISVKSKHPSLKEAEMKYRFIKKAQNEISSRSTLCCQLIQMLYWHPERLNVQH